MGCGRWRVGKRGSLGVILPCKAGAKTDQKTPLGDFGVRTLFLREQSPWVLWLGHRGVVPEPPVLAKKNILNAVSALSRLAFLNRRSVRLKLFQEHWAVTSESKKNIKVAAWVIKTPDMRFANL